MENKIIDITELRDIEFRILSYMVLSFNNITEVNKSLQTKDFTFVVNQKIFSFLSTSEEMFIEMEHKEDINQSIEFIAVLLDEIENIKQTSSLNILSKIPSQNIQKDIETIQNYSFEKDVSVNKKLNFIEVEIEDKNGYIQGFFTNNLLIEVHTTNIFQLPIELCDSFTGIMDHLTKLELQSDNMQTTVTFYGDEENPDGIKSIYIKKDILFLKWFDNICKWADKYELDKDIFPRDRFELESLTKLDISSQNIKELPKEINNLKCLTDLRMDNNQIEVLPLEIFELKHLQILSFLYNNISIIPNEIKNLNNLLILGACDNNIEVLPESFYTLNNLMRICLHGNQLTTLSEKISNFKILNLLTISNNKIKILPNSISELKSLKSIDIENTQISDISPILMMPNLTKISCDDKFLPLLMENLGNFKDIDSVNLSESMYKNDDVIFKNIKLKQKTKRWMEEKDRLDHGCVVLSKCTIQKDIETIRNEYLDTFDVEEYNDKSLKLAFNIVEDEPFKALDILYDINDLNREGIERDKEISMEYLSVDIICSIANRDIDKALELLNDVIEVDYFKLNALKRIDKKFDNVQRKELMKSLIMKRQKKLSKDIENIRMRYD